MVAHFAEVCVRIHFGTAMRTSHLVYRLATLGTEHGLGVIDSSAIGARFTCSLLLLLLHLHGLVFLWKFLFPL
jgi:hypothetical protein